MKRYGVHRGRPEGIEEDIFKCVVEVVDGNKRRQCNETRIVNEEERLCGAHEKARRRGSPLWIPVEVE